MIGTVVEMDRTIAPEDHMQQGGERAYFRTAEAGLRAVLAGVYAAGRDPSEIERILDFGSGYGRVYRALAAGFPHAELTACDLMAPAARFCAETFGGLWAKGHEDLSMIRLPHRYDLTWLGSVFTHLPRARWKALLDFLADASRPRAVCVFTSHGRRALEVHEHYTLKRNPYLIPAPTFERIKATVPEVGFAFAAPQPGIFTGMKDLGIDVSEGAYGVCFASEEWVRARIEELPEWRYVAYVEAGWANNHDTVTIQRR